MPVVTARILTLMLWLLAILFVAVFVHLGSILILPRVAPHDAFGRLVAGQSPATLTPVPAAASGRGSPLQGPRLELGRLPLRSLLASLAGHGFDAERRLSGSLIP